jgi:hypothetical protein
VLGWSKGTRCCLLYPLHLKLLNSTNDKPLKKLRLCPLLRPMNIPVISETQDVKTQ